MYAPRPVCIIGADIPDVTKPAIAAAFAALGDHDAVFGPAPDGGYWLVGAKRTQAGMFADVRWSTRHALADTEVSFKGLRIARIETLRDVDTVADLDN